MSAAAVYGGAEDDGTDPVKNATVRLQTSELLGCSGLLVTPNRVLTAAHCGRHVNSAWVGPGGDAGWHLGLEATSDAIHPRAQPALDEGRDPAPPDDLQILALSERVPPEIATPIRPLPTAPDATEFDAVARGFGASEPACPRQDGGHWTGTSGAGTRRSAVVPARVDADGLVLVDTTSSAPHPLPGDSGSLLLMADASGAYTVPVAVQSSLECQADGGADSPLTAYFGATFEPETADWLRSELELPFGRWVGEDDVVPGSAGDADADGLTLNDNCPADYNPSQADQDGDGVGDVCDLCPEPRSTVTDVPVEIPDPAYPVDYYQRANSYQSGDTARVQIFAPALTCTAGQRGCALPPPCARAPAGPGPLRSVVVTQRRSRIGGASALALALAAVAPSCAERRAPEPAGSGGSAASGGAGTGARAGGGGTPGATLADASGFGAGAGRPSTDGGHGGIGTPGEWPGWHPINQRSCRVYAPDDLEAQIQPLVWGPCPGMAKGCRSAGTGPQSTGFAFSKHAGRSYVAFAQDPVPERQGDRPSDGRGLLAVHDADSGKPLAALGMIASLCVGRIALDEDRIAFRTSFVGIGMSDLQLGYDFYIGSVNDPATFAAPRFTAVTGEEGWAALENFHLSGDWLILDYGGGLAVVDVRPGASHAAIPMDRLGGWSVSDPAACGGIVFARRATNVAGAILARRPSGESILLHEAPPDTSWSPACDGSTLTWLQQTAVDASCTGCGGISLWTSPYTNDLPPLTPRRVASLPELTSPWQRDVELRDGLLSIRPTRIYRVADGAYRQLPAWTAPDELWGDRGWLDAEEIMLRVEWAYRGVALARVDHRELPWEPPVP